MRIRWTRASVAYARQVRVPSSRAGDIVVTDTLTSHERVAAVRAIEDAGASVVYLPPSSPDFHHPAPRQRLERHEQIRRPVPLVLAVLLGRTPDPNR